MYQVRRFSNNAGYKYWLGDIQKKTNIEIVAIIVFEGEISVTFREL